MLGTGWVNNNHATSLSRHSGAIKLADREWSVLYIPKHFGISKYKTIYTTMILHHDSKMN
jgi:hypothetical protein